MSMNIVQLAVGVETTTFLIAVIDDEMTTMAY